jgi:glycosyltransferase involved in cell wall biosynthesis
MPIENPRPFLDDFLDYVQGYRIAAVASAKMKAGIWVGTAAYPMGGTELVTSVTIDVLAKLGWEVDLYVVGRFKTHDLGNTFGPPSASSKCRVRAVKSFFPNVRFHYGGAYLELANNFLEKRFSVSRCDIFIDTGLWTTAGPTYSRIPDVMYWNVPPPQQNLFLARYSIARQMYLRPFQLLVRQLSRQWRAVRLHIANSQFTAGAIASRLGRDLKPVVVYPPVDLDFWMAETCSSRRSGVVSFARFDPWKRQDIQVCIMGGLHSRLRMIGRAITPAEVANLRRLEDHAKEYDNIEFYVNLSQTEVRDLLHSSKVFIHTADTEPFGMTIVEAIAAGCVPVVRDSGASPEIVPFRELRFETIEEARGKIQRAMKGDFDHMLPNLRTHIQRFDQGVFRKLMCEQILRLG